MCAKKNPSGVALIITLLTLTILSLLAVGFFSWSPANSRTSAAGARITPPFKAPKPPLEL